MASETVECRSLMDLDAIFKAYDVRGVVPDELDADAARRIGHETVTYVSNIYKYYIGYKISEARLIEERNQYGHMLHECAEDIS